MVCGIGNKLHARYTEKYSQKLHKRSQQDESKHSDCLNSKEHIKPFLEGWFLHLVMKNKHTYEASQTSSPRTIFQQTIFRNTISNTNSFYLIKSEQKKRKEK